MRSCHRRRVRNPGQLRMRFKMRAVRSEIPAMLLGGAIDVVVPVHSPRGGAEWARFALIGRRLAQTRLCGQQNGRWDQDASLRKEILLTPPKSQWMSEEWVDKTIMSCSFVVDVPFCRKIMKRALQFVEISL